MTTEPLPTRYLKRSQRITLYPGLVSEKRFWLQLYNIEKNIFTVHLYTLTGIQVCKLFLVHDDHYSTHTIRLSNTIERGIYKIAIRCGDASLVQPLIIL